MQMDVTAQVVGTTAGVPTDWLLTSVFVERKITMTVVCVRDMYNED